MSVILDRETAVGKLMEATEPHVLTQALNSLIGDQPTLRRLGVVSQALAHPKVLTPIVDAYIANPDLVNSPTRAYQLRREDADGRVKESFHSVVLTRRFGDDFEADWDVLLHLWFPEQRGKIMGDVHTHSHKFASTVVLGKFRDTMYRVTHEEGQKAFEYSDVAEVPIGEVSLQSTPERVISQGKTHLMSHQAVHQATLDPDSLVATIAVRGKRTPPYGRVYMPASEEYSVPEVIGIEGVESLRRFQKALKAA